MVPLAPFTVTLAGVPLQLLPERAVFLPDTAALLVADVHLGKAETFQHHGIPIPAAVNTTTLERLERLCDRTQARRLIVLGDLFHARSGLVDTVIDGWLAFRQRTGLQTDLIVGNHDRPLISTLRQLSVNCWTAQMTLGAVTLSHEPLCSADSSTHKLNICGHIHPCIRLGPRRDRLRLPCFHWQPRPGCLTLPAFGEFTGGHEVTLGAGQIAYAIAEDQIVAFPP